VKIGDRGTAIRRFCEQEWWATVATHAPFALQLSFLETSPRFMNWHILTGEYPPQSGGVSDYTWQVAHALAAGGNSVDVWTPAVPGQAADEGVVRVHHLPDCYGPRSLALLDRGLRDAPRPFQLLVQYVPYLYGFRGLNLLFCVWLRRFRLAPVWVMFHEVAFPMGRGLPLRHNVLGAAHRVMAWLVGRRAQRVFVSTLAWIPLLRRLLPRRRAIEWLAVPSTIPLQADPMASAQVRSWAAPDDTVLVGHFGTYGDHVADLLRVLVPEILARHGRVRFLFLGRGGKQFAVEVKTTIPGEAHRLEAPGGLPPQALADHLAACDLLLQPYPDGVTSRRTSIMAGLGLGIPVITNSGHLTESLWSSMRAVALAADPSVAAYAPLVAELLESDEARHRLARAGVEAYQRFFALERTVAVLQGKQQAMNLVSG
jgi:glycosyltransferase involved in cell wall biosynthesis